MPNDPRGSSPIAIIIRDSGLLVLQVPGTASTSIGKGLQDTGRAELLGPLHGTVDELRNSGANLSDIRQIACLVRNHFDMLHAEWYRSRTRWVLEITNPHTVGGWPPDKLREITRACAMDFSDYIVWMFQDAHRNRRNLALYSQFTRDCTNIFKMERIDEFTEWLATLGIPVNLPQDNRSSGRREYWRDYTADARELVTTLFRDELERLGYVF